MPKRSNLKIYCGVLQVAPLMDVLFLLLIFFLLNSTRVFIPGIPIDLPKAAASAPRMAEKIIITMTSTSQTENVPGDTKQTDAKTDSDGESAANEDKDSGSDKSTLLFINEEQVNWDELKRKLAELVIRHKQARRKLLETTGRAGKPTGDAEPRRYSPLVVLNADADVPYRKVVRVMSIARSQNLGVFLATEHPRERQPSVLPFKPNSSAGK